jgi:hypothetical protein
MVHPLALVKGLFRQDLESWRGHSGGSIVSYQFYASDERRGFVGGAKWAMAPTGGPLRAALTNGGSWGDDHHHFVRDRFGCSAHWGLVCEDLPNPENRVDLSPTLTDRAGLAAPRITYRIDDNTHALCANGTSTKARESLVEAGAWHTEVEFRYPPNGHFMGTARMGDDRHHSVVDRWSMAHDVPNLGDHRRQHVRHLRGREPHQFHLRAGPAGGGPSAGAPGGRAFSRAPSHSVHTGAPCAGRPARSARHGRSPAERARAPVDDSRPVPAGPESPTMLIPAGRRHALGRRGGRGPGTSSTGCWPPCPRWPERSPRHSTRTSPRKTSVPWLDGLAARDRAAFGSVALAVAGAYYLDRRGSRSDWATRDRSPKPVRAAAFPEYVDEGSARRGAGELGPLSGRGQNCEATSSW